MGSSGVLGDYKPSFGQTLEKASLKPEPTKSDMCAAANMLLLSADKVEPK